MTAKTLTLNPGVGGPKLLTDSLTQVDGAAAPDDAEAQFAKLGFGNQNSLTSVSDSKGLPVEPLGKLAIANQVAAGVATATVALNAATTRVSLVCIGGDACIRIYTGTDQSALTTDHYLQAGERIDVRCDPGSKIAAIRAGSTSATVRISELG